MVIGFIWTYCHSSTQQNKLRVKQDLLTIIGLITNYLWNQMKQFNGKSCVSHDIFTIFKNIDSSSYLLCWKPHMGVLIFRFVPTSVFSFPATRVDHVQVILNVFIFITTSVQFWNDVTSSHIWYLQSKAKNMIFDYIHIQIEYMDNLYPITMIPMECEFKTWYIELFT